MLVKFKLLLIVTNMLTVLYKLFVRESANLYLSALIANVSTRAMRYELVTLLAVRNEDRTLIIGFFRPRPPFG